jgi:hypothetical protein
MTELEAVHILRNPFSGPSARYDAETTLADLGWPPLAIRLARNEDIGPAGQDAGPGTLTAGLICAAILATDLPAGEVPNRDRE